MSLIERDLLSELAGRARKIFQKIEGDTALLYNLIGTVINACAGPAVLFIVATRLSAHDQGVYYTFASLAGLSIFIELGVAQTVSISVAHLASRLTLRPNGKLTGDASAIRELAAICKFYLAWYLMAAVAVFTLLILFGPKILSRGSGMTSDWSTPWLLFSAAIALGLPQYPFHFILYGLGNITKISLWRLIVAAARLFILAVALLANLGLYAQGLAALATALLGFLFPLEFWFLWKTLLSEQRTPIGEIASNCLNFQWKVAIGWLVGYAATYFLTPLLFHQLGAVSAGQFGATFSLANAAATVGLAWMHTRVPRAAELVSLGDQDGFKKLSQRLIMIVGGCGLFCLFLLFFLYAGALYFNLALLHRFMSFTDLFLIGLSCWCYMEFGVLASLLRSFRSEPLLIESAVGAILMVILPFLFIPIWGIRGAVAGHLCGSSVILAAAAIHYRSFLLKWRESPLV